MIVHLSFAEIQKIRPDGSYTTTISLLAAPKVPDERHDCPTPASVRAFIARYTARAEASGLCGKVYVYNKSPRGVRAVSGFKALAEETGRAFVNKHVGLAAGEAEPALF